MENEFPGIAIDKEMTQMVLRLTSPQPPQNLNVIFKKDRRQTSRYPFKR